MTVICKACGEECSVITIDVGIGFFEYWGAPGFDSRVYSVSSCCEADFEEVTDLQERVNTP